MSAVSSHTSLDETCEDVLEDELKNGVAALVAKTETVDAPAAAILALKPPANTELERWRASGGGHWSPYNCCDGDPVLVAQLRAAADMCMAEGDQ